MNCELLNDRGCSPEGVRDPCQGAWPDHLLAPGVLGWAWWKDAVLRSAGFQADQIVALSDPLLGGLADVATKAESMLHGAIEKADGLLRRRIQALRNNGADNHRDEIRRIGRAQKQLRALTTAGNGLSVMEELPADLVEELRAAAARRDATFSDLRRAFSESASGLSRTVRTFAEDPIFRTAVAWQNLEAVHTVLDALASDRPMSGSKRKQREALVGSYVQRYCTKNDTIGFFGPMAWVRIEDSELGCKFDPGTDLVRARSVHFEDWAVESLAHKFASNDRYLPWLVAYRQPFLNIERHMLRLPGGQAIRLSDTAARLLALCDGVATVGELAKIALADPFGPFATESDVFAELRSLERSQRLRLAFPIPSCQDDPDSALRRCFDAIDDEHLRREALFALDSLIAGKAEVIAAADDPERISTALNNLEEQFARVVGGPSRRRPGEVYGGRALVYEDCHRDVSLTISSRALKPATDALELVMASARWFTTNAYRQFNVVFDVEFDRICADRELERIRLSEFWLSAQSILFGDRVPIEALAQELRDRWEVILLAAGSPACRRIDLAVADIRDRVSSEFRTDSAAWRLSRYQCPDLMFCAQSPEHLLRGEYLAVLGEVHVGGNTLATNLFASQHPDRERLLANLGCDLGVPYVMPKLSPLASGTPTRTQWLDDPEKALEIVFSGGFIPANPLTAMPTADLEVIRRNGRLTVRHESSGREIPLADAFGDFLFLAVINCFGLMHKRSHTPRVTVGRLVVQRETWSFSAEELPFCYEADECELFRAARAWMNRLELPDRVFVKMGWEAKPVYVDFNSILSIRMIAKQVRHALEDAPIESTTITFSEVLPNFDELWLTDAEGRHYTSELRLVAIHKDDAGAN